MIKNSVGPSVLEDLRNIESCHLFVSFCLFLLHVADELSARYFAIVVAISFLN